MPCTTGTKKGQDWCSDMLPGLGLITLIYSDFVLIARQMATKEYCAVMSLK